jgi:hypothetical protein
MAKDLMSQYNPSEPIPDEENVETHGGASPSESEGESETQVIPFSERKTASLLKELSEQWDGNIEAMATNYGANVQWMQNKLGLAVPPSFPEQRSEPKGAPVQAVPVQTHGGASPATPPVSGLPSPVSVRLVHYTPKSVALIGDTRPLKDQLAALWGKYCPNLHIEGQTVKGWIFSAKREAQLKQLIAS